MEGSTLRETREVTKGPRSSQTRSGDGGGGTGSQGHRERLAGRTWAGTGSDSTRGVRRTRTGFSGKMTRSLREVSEERRARKPEA